MYRVKPVKIDYILIVKYLIRSAKMNRSKDIKDLTIILYGIYTCMDHAYKYAHMHYKPPGSMEMHMSSFDYLKEHWIKSMNINFDLLIENIETFYSKWNTFKEKYNFTADEFDTQFDWFYQYRTSIQCIDDTNFTQFIEQDYVTKAENLRKDFDKVMESMV